MYVLTHQLNLEWLGPQVFYARCNFILINHEIGYSYSSWTLGLILFGWLSAFSGCGVLSEVFSISISSGCCDSRGLNLLLSVMGAGPSVWSNFLFLVVLPIWNPCSSRVDLSPVSAVWAAPVTVTLVF